jgi:hypothetical protein
MPRAQGNRGVAGQWLVVLAVGVIVVAVVLGLRLIPRLNAGQDVLDAARPAFTTERVQADRAGVNVVSEVVQMADPIVNKEGGAADEVPAVVSYVAKARGVNDQQALAALRKEFPHTTALLESLPLSSVTTELPKLVDFLAKTLMMSPDQVNGALKSNFPAIEQAVRNLPTVTKNWDSIANVGSLTRFDGTPVRSVPEFRDYASSDLVPVLERQQGNFRSLDGTSTVNWIAPLLLAVGLIVIAFAAVMIGRCRRGIGRAEAVWTATVVPVVGLVVVVLVLGLKLIPRTSDGQDLIDGLKPAMTADRVAGDRAGVAMVSAIVDTADPLMTPQGGAAAEVPKLVAFVAKESGLAPDAVLAALSENFPHTTALLQALPLTEVAKELPAVTKALQPALGSVPHIAQAATALPKVTAAWLQVPGVDGATRFDGTRIATVPDVRTYLSGDVIPVLETQRSHFGTLAGTSKINFIGPLVLVVGLIVLGFGLFMLAAARKVPLRGRAVSTGVPADAGRREPTGSRG